MKYIRLYESDGYVLVHETEDPRIDAAVSRYIDNGRDTLLLLDCLDGSVYRCLASNIRSWYTSTPESRRQSLAWERDSKAEAKELRISLGIWEDE